MDANFRCMKKCNDNIYIALILQVIYHETLIIL